MHMSENRLKVLIADDEYRIGMLIKKLIKWDELNLECVKIVDNGLTALEAIEEVTPDIVITDIQMPIVNGLELIAKASKENENIKFIVISGYKDFEYAHKALQYGVNSYLLKPIKGIELNDSLDKITNNINERLFREKEEEIQKKEIHTSKKIIKRNILKGIIDNQAIPALEEVEGKFGVKLDYPLFRVIDIKLDYWNLKKTSKKQDSITIEKITGIIESTFSDGLIKELIYATESLHIYVLLNYKIEKSKDVINSINTLLIDIEEYLLGFEQYEVTIGIGREKNEFNAMLDSVQEAEQSVNNRVGLGTGILIYTKVFNSDTKNIIDDMIKRYSENYISGIHSYAINDFRKAADDIFDDIASCKDIDFSYYYYLSEQLINMFFENIEEKNEQGNDLKKYLLDVYEHCYTPAKLKDLFITDLSEYLNLCLKNLEIRSTKPIREAKRYIEENYSKKITLEDIAEIVDLNPVYFSVLFKKETGLNFSSYLVGMRMEKAKEMLKNTNETIAAISGILGYKDVRYFSRLFTKTVGVKPTVYRRLYS